jgi:excisionase family DNA binding protein
MRTQKQQKQTLMKTYSVQEAAQILKAAVFTVRSWIRGGKLKAHKVGGHYVILDRDLRAFLHREDKAA